MIRRALVAVLVGGLCLGSFAEAADIPFSVLAKPAKQAKNPVIRKKPAKVAVVPAQKPVKPAVRKLPEVAPDVATLAPETAPEPAPVAPATPDVAQELELSWFLDPLVANADGPKGEGASSMEGNLIVADPGYVSSPNMVIELTGHVVKTPDTTVRVDIQIGSVYRSVTWTNDEVKSGRFSVAINAPMKAGKLPGYFPVSALAFVTRNGKSGAAMVSVERVTVRLGKVSQVAKQ